MVERIKSRKLAELFLDELALKDGHQVHYVYFGYPESVAVIPLIDEDHVMLIGQYRYPIDSYSWELPAGSVHTNESVHDAARRELLEEGGVEAETMEYLFPFYPSNAMSNEKIHLFRASGLVKQTSGRADKELLEKDLTARKFDLREIDRLISDGKITDAATLIGVKYRDHRGGQTVGDSRK